MKSKSAFNSSTKDIMMEKYEVGSDKYYLQWGLRRVGGMQKDSFKYFSNGAFDKTTINVKQMIITKQGKCEKKMLDYCIALVRSGQFSQINEDCVKLAAYFVFNEMSNGIKVNLPTE